MKNRNYNNNHSANDNWLQWAILLFFAALLLLWLVTNIMKILIIPIFSIGVLLFILAIIFHNYDEAEKMLIWSVIVIIISLILFIIVAAIEGSILWPIAENTAKTITDSNILTNLV